GRARARRAPPAYRTAARRCGASQNARAVPRPCQRRPPKGHFATSPPHARTGPSGHRRTARQARLGEGTSLSSLACMAVPSDTVRIAAIGDLHYGKAATPGALQPLLSSITESADILIICGDLTDSGLAEEARALAKELTASVKIPIVGVLGNHDYEAGQQDEICRIMKDAGVVTLDGGTTEILGIGFAGIKGFAGGFGRRALGPWGEDIIKRFVHEAVAEALKLETALARLRTGRLIAILHYPPVQATVEG